MAPRHWIWSNPGNGISCCSTSACPTAAASKCSRPSTKPAPPVLVLSMYSANQYALRVMRAGAAGYLSKESAPDQLLEAVQKITSGTRYVSAEMAESIAHDWSRNPDQGRHETLSDREFEVMRLIASGKSVGDIARELALSVKTISTYRARVLQKLQLRHNAELTHYAIVNKLISIASG